jgi:hypothetical protein
MAQLTLVVAVRVQSKVRVVLEELAELVAVDEVVI